MVSIMVLLTLIPMLLSALYMIANQLGWTKKAEDMVLEVEAASVMDQEIGGFPEEAEEIAKRVDEAPVVAVSDGSNKSNIMPTGTAISTPATMASNTTVPVSADIPQASTAATSSNNSTVPATADNLPALTAARIAGITRASTVAPGSGSTSTGSGLNVGSGDKPISRSATNPPAANIARALTVPAGSVGVPPST